MADIVGRKLGPYEIRSVIGRGGMANVYLAYQPALHREIAVKVLNGVMSQDAEFVTRFQREALTAGRLKHPNILRIYDAGAFEGHQYIAMDLAPGGTLADRMLRGPALRHEETAALIAQVADALDYAHRHGVVHRDIKPSNILLDEEGRPLLADFGIAHTFTATDPRMTLAGVSMGTPEYMAPEQAEGRPVDGRSDLFSLGVVLYQMATGKTPFKGETPIGTLFQVIQHTPPPPRAVNPAVPAYLDAIIQKALAKRPEDRFQSGQELAQALRERRVVTAPPRGAEADRGAQGGRPPTPGRTRQGAARPPANRGPLAALLVFALVAVVAAAYFAIVAFGRGAQTDTAGQRLTAAPSAAPAAALPPTVAPEVTRPAEPSPTPAVAAEPTAAATAAPATAAPATAAPATAAPATDAPATDASAASTLAPTVLPATSTATPPPTAAATAAPPATPTATATNALPTEPPTATFTPLPPGLVLNFENFGNWRIGNELHGAFGQSSEQKHDGQLAGKLDYRFPAVEKNYVVFRRSPVAPIPGQPPALRLWVYGDGSGHFLNMWVRDAGSEVRQFTFGKINHTGWQEMAAALDTAAPWPQAHISGPDNGRLDFPISVDGILLDGVPDGGGPFTGAIFVDELRTSDVATTRSEAAPPPDAGADDASQPRDAAATPTASDGAAPAAALGGRIVYTNAGGGVSALDVASRNTWELMTNARQPDITRDGRVAVNAAGGGRDNLWVVKIDGAANWMAGMHPEDSYPSWSPSGVSVAFHSTLQGDGKDRIYVQRDMGHAEEPRRLLINKTDAFGKYPTWLENWRIAFTGCNYWAEGSRCGIWTTNSDDSGGPALVSDGPTDVSSDSAGGVLLYASQRPGNWDVFAVGANGGAPRNLTNHPAQDLGATFSPDGRYVAFMSNRDGWGIWVMNADGSAAQKLLAVPGFGPNWTEERLAWGP